MASGLLASIDPLHVRTAPLQASCFEFLVDIFHLKHKKSFSGELTTYPLSKEGLVMIWVGYTFRNNDGFEITLFIFNNLFGMDVGEG